MRHNIHLYRISVRCDYLKLIKCLKGPIHNTMTKYEKSQHVGYVISCTKTPSMSLQIQCRYSCRWPMSRKWDTLSVWHVTLFPTYMMTSSNGNIFRVTGPLCGEFIAPIMTSPVNIPAQWPVTLSFHVLFDLCLNEQLSKQSWGWWLRRHRAHYDVSVMNNPSRSW